MQLLSDLKELQGGLLNAGSTGQSRRNVHLPETKVAFLNLPLAKRIRLDCLGHQIHEEELDNHALES